MEQKSWFYRKFICGHWYSGQIKMEKHNGKKRHYRECQKCGHKIWIN